MTDLEIEGVGSLTTKEVITSGADQRGGLKWGLATPYFGSFFLKSIEFFSLINKLNYLKMGIWRPKLLGLKFSI